MTQQTLIPTAAQTETTSGLAAHHLVAMLRRHYIPDNRPVAGIFASEIASPCGKRRADLIWMPTTIAGGRGLHGHEIKVTRTDLLTELADPTKADPWATYCSRWWLVVAHPGLVAGLDIPESWGVMAPPSGRRTRTMTVIKPAPALSPDEPGPGIARLAAWQLYGTSDRISRMETEIGRLTKERDHLQRRVAELLGAGARGDSPEAKRIAHILNAVTAGMKDQNIWISVSDDDIVAAILDSAATSHAACSVRSQLRGVVLSVQRLVAPFDNALRDLQKAEQLAAALAKSDVNRG